MRVGASRRAAAPAPAATARAVSIATTPGQPGETCVRLQDTQQRTLAQRCTYAVVWTASATQNRESWKRRTVSLR